VTGSWPPFWQTLVEMPNSSPQNLSQPFSFCF